MPSVRGLVSPSWPGAVPCLRGALFPDYRGREKPIFGAPPRSDRDPSDVGYSTGFDRQADLRTTQNIHLRGKDIAIVAARKPLWATNVLATKRPASNN